MESKLIVRTPSSAQEWDAYYDLRFRVLREPLGQPRGSERNEGDETGEHFALYENGRLLAIARLDEVDKDVFQTRFVAVEIGKQGRGYGKMIMQAVEQRAKEKGCELMVLHARDYAFDFYLNLGYKSLGKSYKLFGVLQHYKMEKELD
jgi:predicted GNAT family N-acyltransferase